jgi:hypothetical protein
MSARFKSANVIVESMMCVCPIAFAATLVATMPVRREPSTAGSWPETFKRTSWLAPLKAFPCLVTLEGSTAELAIEPVILAPETATMEASCTALTATEDAITLAPSAPAPTLLGASVPTVNFPRSRPEAASLASVTAASATVAAVRAKGAETMSWRGVSGGLASTWSSSQRSLPENTEGVSAVTEPRTTLNIPLSADTVWTSVHSAAPPDSTSKTRNVSE